MQPCYRSQGLMGLALKRPTPPARREATLAERLLPHCTCRLLKEMKTARETPRTTRKYDASNFDDYLVVGLILVVFAALLAALLLL